MCLRIWSRETGSAVPSRVSLLILHAQVCLPNTLSEGKHIPSCKLSDKTIDDIVFKPINHWSIKIVQDGVLLSHAAHRA